MLYVQFYKVTSLPTIGAPHSWYLLINGDYCETYVTDNAGAFKKVGNSDMISELNDIKLEDAPNDGKQYARKNKSW